MLPNMNEIGDMLRGGAADVKREAEHHVQRILHRLEDITESLARLEVSEDYRRLTQIATVAADGTVSVEVGRPRNGYVWVIQRVGVSGTALTDIRLDVGGFPMCSYPDLTEDIYADSVGDGGVWVPPDTLVEIAIAATADTNVAVVLQAVETRVD